MESCYVSGSCACNLSMLMRPRDLSFDGCIWIWTNLPSQHNWDQTDCSSEDGIQCIIDTYTHVINSVQMKTLGFFLYSSQLDMTAKLCPQR